MDLKTKVLCLSLFLLMISNLFAQTTGPYDFTSVGVAVGQRSYIYKNGNVPFPVLPFFIIKKGAFTFQGIALSYSLYQKFPMIQLTLTPNLLMLKDKGGISTGIHTRYWTIQGGIRVVFPTPFFSISFHWEHDLLNRHKGNIMGISIRRLFPIGMNATWTLTPSLFGKYYDKRYVNYYFGVSQEEATTYRPSFEGRESFEYGVGLTISYLLNKSESLNLSVSESFFDKHIHTSPLVAKKYMSSYYLGYAHTL